MQHTNRTAGWLSYKSTPYRDRTFSELRSAKLESTLAQAWPSYTYQPFRKGLISRSSRQKIAFSSNQPYQCSIEQSYPNNGETLSRPQHSCGSPTAIRHATPPKTSCALAPKPTVKLSIYWLTQTGALSKSPKTAASQSIPCGLSERVNLKI